MEAMTDGKPNYAFRCNEAARLLIRTGRNWVALTGEDIDRGARAVRRDYQYRKEIFQTALNYADYASRPGLRAELIAAQNLLDSQPLPYGRQCWYTFALPWWAGEDQMDPCRCDLHINHEGDHECEHTRAKKGTCEA